MTFAQQVQHNNSDLLYLVKGEANGLDVWEYILVDKTKLPLLKMILKNRQTLDPHKYGKVICFGYGKEPPQDIQDKIKSEFAS